VKFSLGFSFQREFLSADFYTFETFDEVGLSQLFCVNWLLTWYVVSSEAGLSSLVRPQGRELRTWGTGAFCFYLKQHLDVHPSSHSGPSLLSKADCSSQAAPVC